MLGVWQEASKLKIQATNNRLFEDFILSLLEKDRPEFQALVYDILCDGRCWKAMLESVLRQNMF